MERSFLYPRSPGILLCSARPDASLTCFAQDDVMIEIFFDNAKDSIGMSIESSILTEPQSERLASEWSKIVMGVIPGGREV